MDGWEQQETIRFIRKGLHQEQPSRLEASSDRKGICHMCQEGVNNVGVIRIQKNSNYVVMSKVGLHDDRLSWKAKGLLAYMLSMPDNWTFYNEELMKHSPDGSSTFKAAMNELKEYGYVVRRKAKDEKGKFIGWETVVYEQPIEDECRKVENRPSENRPSENRPSENRPSKNRPSKNDPLLNNKELNNNLLNNKEINDDDIGKPNPFVEFENAFGYLPPQMLIEEFNYWIDESQFVEPEAIICEVIKRARLQIPRNPSSYISKILRDLHRLGLFTLDAVKEYNEKFDHKTKQRTGKAKVVEKHGRDIPEDFVFDINAGEDWL